jgi:hypothetical protein
MEVILDNAGARTPWSKSRAWASGSGSDDDAADYRAGHGVGRGGDASRGRWSPLMSFDQVRGLGGPTGEVVFGNKARGSLADMTVVFEDGKVTEVKS